MTTPTLIVTQQFADADAALAHAATIYDAGIAHLRQSLHDFVAGTTPTTRVRACYPFVRVRTDTVARADSRLSYGFVAGPGVYETTLTRPDLFAGYYRESGRLPRDGRNTEREQAALAWSEALVGDMDHAPR